MNVGRPVVAYVTHEEAFGAPMRVDELESAVSTLSLEDCLQSLGKISSLVPSGRLTRMQVDELLARDIESVGGTAIAYVQAGRPIVFGSRLGALARVAILHADRRPPDAFRGGADRASFLRALLGVADALEPVGGMEASNPRAVDMFASLMLRRSANVATGTLRSAIPRYERFFSHLPTAHPELLDGVNFDTLLRQRAGIDVRRYLAICFAILTRFMASDVLGGDGTDWLLEASWFSEADIDPGEFRAVVETLSATPDELCREFALEAAAGRAGLEDLRPFAIHPLCEIRPGTFLPVDVALLGRGLVGDGLYWRLVPEPRASQAQKEQFGRALGRIVEAHCLAVASSAYPAFGGAVRICGEVMYDGSHGPDVVVFDGPSTAFIEIGIDRINVRDTLFQGDLGSYDRDVDEILLGRVRQLDRKITAARQGRLNFPGVPGPETGRIFPVVCLIDGFPLGFGLRQRIDAAVVEADLLSQPNIDRLAVIGLDEFEALFGMVERGQTLSSMLADYAQDRFAGFWPIEDWIIARSGEMPMPTFMKNEFARVSVEYGRAFGFSPPAP